MSPEALISRTNIHRAEGQHITCTQERDSIVPHYQENEHQRPRPEYPAVPDAGHAEAEGQYSSPSQTNSHYRLTGGVC